MDDDMVYNMVQFIVCREDITTSQEAEEFVDSWLDDSPAAEVFDWKAYADRFYHNVFEYALHPEYDKTIILGRYNQTLILLGAQPVMVMQPKEVFYQDQQSELAI